ncbi:MAG: SDR family NAD(P)-dependent oxidoreductase [Beijerinckiaceae bacterium]
MSARRELEGHVALVTGAAKNIGRAIAIALAEGGAKVMCASRRNAAELAETVRLIRTGGGAAESVLADVTDEASVAAMVAATLDRFGRLDVLVNNAAVRTEMPFADLTLAEFRKVTSVALEGPFLCARAALAALQASGHGAIINIGGLTAYTGARDRAHVVAAKAGLDGLTKALAQDLAAAGITVNLVSPGLIDTQRGGHNSKAPTHHATHATLLGRKGRPDEVAAMVRHLAGPGGRYITGQTIHVNGGAYLP